MQTLKFVHVVETVSNLPPPLFYKCKNMQLGFYKILATIQIFPYAEKKTMYFNQVHQLYKHFSMLRGSHQSMIKSVQNILSCQDIS